MEYLLSLIVLVISGLIIWKVCKTKYGAVRWIYIEIIYNCFIKFVMGFLGLPSVLNYLTDVFLIITVFHFLFERKRGFERKVPGSLQIVALIYFAVTVISYVINLYSPLLYIWGFRNNMRFLIFAIMCAVYLKIQDVYKIMNILYCYFFLNIVTVTYEYFFAGFVFRTGDLISGLYSEGTVSGGNGALNFYLCIMSTMAIVMYLNGEKNAKYMFLILAGTIYMASLSELKIFFVEIVLISVLAVLLCKRTNKHMIFLVIGSIGLLVGIQLLYRMFPQYAGYFSMENLTKSLFLQGSYAGEQSMSRTGAVAYVWENFLTTIPKKLFGYGFGNADYSKYSFLTSDFYRMNKATVYQWFYGPFILIETGVAGLMTYIYMLLNFLKRGILLRERVGKKDSLLAISIIVTVLSFIILFYDASLKTESTGYLAFFFMTIPYIVKKHG